MFRKSYIVLLFATVAQSSRDLGRSGSCAPATQIMADLETMQFAEDTERFGYLRSAQVAYSEILAVLADRSSESKTDSEEADLRAQLAQNESLTGPLNGVLPNCEAIRIIQPKLDIPTVVKVASAGREGVNRNVFLGIKAAQGNDYPKAKVQIAKYSKLARSGAVSAIRLFYSAMTNGSNPIPDEAKAAIDCTQAKTETAIDAAFGAIFEEINILARAIIDNKMKDAVDEITAAHKKASDSFNAEISYKFSTLRNIAFAQYFEKAGTITGLFAIQSTFM